MNVIIQGNRTEQKMELKERIESGDLFFSGKSKGTCASCASVVDIASDKYCWKCGNALSEGQ